MELSVVTAGEVLHADSDVGWVTQLLQETFDGRTHLPGESRAGTPTVRLVVEHDSKPFSTRGGRIVTRGAQLLPNGAVIFADACGSGFDLLVRPRDDELSVTARYRPPARVRAANTLLRTRFMLLARATLTQYPVLWWAGVRGRAPLHVSAVTVGERVVVLAGPSGVGKSTLIRGAIEAGNHATSDNLAVSDGVAVFGVAEPTKSDTGSGRRTSHGRREEPLRQAVETLEPDLILLVSLRDEPPALVDTGAQDAVRALVTSTYMAGELSRYWPFAATLAGATGRGPAHPAIESVAERIVAGRRAYALSLSRQEPVALSELLSAPGDVVGGSSRVG
jgi:hypothetical protein